MFARLIWLPAGTEPNWGAAFRKAAELRYADVDSNLEAQYSGLYDTVTYEIHEARQKDRDHDPDIHLRGIARQALEEVKNAIDGDDRQMIEFHVPGWRLFFTGDFGDDETELGDTIRDLEPLGLLEAAGFNPKRLTVEVIIYSNRHGIDVSCHLPHDADGVRAEIARDNWDEIQGYPGGPVPDEPPEDDLEAVSIFIENLTGGTYLDSELVSVKE